MDACCLDCIYRIRVVAESMQPSSGYIEYIEIRLFRNPPRRSRHRCYILDRIYGVPTNLSYPYL